MIELFQKKPFLIMGILNVTKDSFYDGGKYYSLEKGVERAYQMKEEGADIIDIGAESTRPFSEGMHLYEEKERIEKILLALNNSGFDIPISVDTQKSLVAQTAIELGAEIINDVSGGRREPEILDIVSKNKKFIILMHMKGTPKDMQVNPRYDDVVNEVKSELLS
ncbi:MAG: dihydropteroate synthase, partial [Acidobacteria bacterium]|nr:dihydropteroate synthase [Acidobacteriota bacterium]